MRRIITLVTVDHRVPAATRGPGSHHPREHNWRRHDGRASTAHQLSSQVARKDDSPSCVTPITNAPTALRTVSVKSTEIW